MKIIKVKLVGKTSTKALISESINLSDPNQGVCFHAYSERMKAAVLDYMVANPRMKIELSFTNEDPKSGEWME